MNTLFDPGAQAATSSASVMRAEGMKSLEATRGAFRLIQLAQHGLKGITDAGVAKWVAANAANAKTMAEISEVVNENARHDRLRQLGSQAATAAACCWLRKSHPGNFDLLIGPLRGFTSERWEDGRVAMWWFDEKYPLFLLWNLLTLNLMTRDSAAEKMTPITQLDLWDQSFNAFFGGGQLMCFRPRFPQYKFLVLDFSHVADARSFLAARDYERGTR